MTTLLLALVLTAGPPPKPVKQYAGPTKPASQFSIAMPVEVPELMHGGYVPPKQLTEREYQIEKKRYAEWLVHQRAAARAGKSIKGGYGKGPVRQSTARVIPPSGGRGGNLSVHDDYINQAQEAVRQVQGR